MLSALREKLDGDLWQHWQAQKLPLSSGVWARTQPFVTPSLPPHLHPPPAVPPAPLPAFCVPLPPVLAVSMRLCVIESVIRHGNGNRCCQSCRKQNITSRSPQPHSHKRSAENISGEVGGRATACWAATPAAGRCCCCCCCRRRQRQAAPLLPLLQAPPPPQPALLRRRQVRRRRRLLAPPLLRRRRWAAPAGPPGTWPA